MNEATKRAEKRRQADAKRSFRTSDAYLPGSQIVESMDLAKKWRFENRPVVSGFHTHVEKE